MDSAHTHPSASRATRGVHLRALHFRAERAVPGLAIAVFIITLVVLLLVADAQACGPGQLI